MKTIDCKHCNKPLAQFVGVPGDDDQWYHIEKEREEITMMYVEESTSQIWCAQCVDKADEENEVYFFFEAEIIEPGDKVTCTQCEKEKE